MADDEDDYLSDKFLFGSTQSAPAKPQTYAERRKQAKREAEIKNVQNRKKSRKQLEEESREEGLRASLFERAKAEEERYGRENKALSMMMKMGFKPGQSLGRATDEVIKAGDEARERVETPPPQSSSSTVVESGASGSHSSHRVQPLPIDVWTGKKGVGLGKRAVSPGATDKQAKVARLDEESERDSYRTRTREDYEERRAEGRLRGATRTLLTLDEKAAVKFNVLSLNPQDAHSFPPGLVDALSDSMTQDVPDLGSPNLSQNDRLRQQMRHDALQPLDSLGPEVDITSAPGSSKELTVDTSIVTPEIIEASKAFLRLSARERLGRVLTYLRVRHQYCLWCGTKYEDEEDMSGNCPGEDEELHD